MDNIDFQQFKQQSSEFFKATLDRKALSYEQAENGHKCIALMYLRNVGNWAELDSEQANIILELAGKRLLEVELHNTLNRQ